MASATLCSICGSPTPDDPPTIFVGKKRSQKSRAKTKNLKPGKSEKVSVPNAKSFCSAFGVPTDKFVPVLTNRKKTFCQGCSGHILAIDSIIKQIEELRMQLEWHKKEIEDNIRVSNLCRSNGIDGAPSNKMDYEIIDLMLLHFPHLVTIKTEIEEGDPLVDANGCGWSDASDAGAPSCFFPAIGVKQEVLNTNIINTTSSRSDLGLSSPTPTPAGTTSSPKQRRAPRAASVKVGTTLAQQDKSDKINKLDLLDESSSSEAEDTDDSDDYEPEPEPPRKRVKAGGKVSRQRGTDQLGKRSESKYAGASGVGGVLRLTPKIVAERKEILKLMEDRPGLTMRQMKNHFRRSEVARSFKNLSCKAKWRNEIAEFEKNIEDAAAGRCSRCISGFNKLSTLRYHFMDIHPPRSNFICQICEQALGSQESVTSHSALHVPTDKKEYSCLQCDTLLPDLQSLGHHTWLHEFKQFKCPRNTCRKFFPTTYAFAGHQCRNRPKNFVCEECGMSFRSVNPLARHKLTHSDEKTFQCPICPDWRFKRDFTRVTHMRKVHGYHGPGAKYPPEVPPGQGEGAVAAASSEPMGVHG